MNKRDELPETETGDAIFGLVTHTIPNIVVEYKHKGTWYGLEIPLNKENNHLRVDDKVEMQLLLMKSTYEPYGVPSYESTYNDLVVSYMDFYRGHFVDEYANQNKLRRMATAYAIENTAKIFRGEK